MGHLGAAAILLYLAGVVGNALGFAAVRTVGLSGGNPATILAFQLNNYLNSYGVILFGSSLVVAWFLGQSWKILTTD